MVHQSFSPCVCAKNLPSNQEDSVSCSKWGYSPSESETAYSVMQGVSGQLIDCNISGGFADVLMIMSFWTCPFLSFMSFPGCHYTVTNHPFVVRCLKVVFNCRKLIPCARYQETWMSNLSWSIWNCYIFWKSSLSRSLPSNWLPC